jgi:hypothetical protein
LNQINFLPSVKMTVVESLFPLFILLLLLLLIVIIVYWYYQQSVPTDDLRSGTLNTPLIHSISHAIKRDVTNYIGPGPQASNVPISFINTLGTLPATLIQYFASNFGQVDLSNFGIPGTNGTTRGPLSNINITGEVSGKISIPVLGNVYYQVNNITGLDGLQATPITIVSPSSPTNVNPITSYWNYATGVLHVNTTIAINIPQVQANVTLNVPACSNVTATFTNVQIIVDLGIDYLPQLGAITKITVEPNPLRTNVTPYYGPAPTPFNVSLGSHSFSCSFSPLSPFFDTLLNDVFSGRIIAPVNNTVPGILFKYLNQGLSSYNSTINNFITTTGIVDAKLDVLVTDLATIAQKFIQFVSGLGVSPSIVTILQTELAKGLAAVQVFFEWPNVTYSCQTTMYSLGTLNPFPYNTGSIQPNIAPYVGPYKTRGEAGCTNVQRFGCNATGNSCIPTANGPFVWDPKNGDQTQLSNCATNCTLYACRVNDNTCVSELECLAAQGNACYPYRTKSNVCDNKCPAYALITSGPETGFCIPTLGGPFYNDPTCGKGNTGICIVEQINKLCYSSYPADDGFVAQGAAMTADACANLGTLVTSGAPTFIPGGTCTAAPCVGISCVGSSVPCLPQPEGQFNQILPWTIAHCLPNT